MGFSWINNIIRGQPSQHVKKDFKKEIKRLEKRLKGLKNKENSKAEGKCLEDIGFVYFKTKLFQEAVDYWEEALRVYQETNDRPSMAESYSNIGTAYRLMGDLPQAARFYNKALVLDHEFNSSEGELKSLHNIGSTWLELGEYENALDIFNNAMELARKERNRNWEALSLYRLGLTYRASHQYRESFRFYEEGLKVAEQANFLEMMTRCTWGLGHCYEMLGEYSQAILCYEDAQLGAKNLKDNDLQILVFISHALLLIHIGLLDRGREMANLAVTMDSDSLIVQAELSLLRAKIYSIYNMREKVNEMLDSAEMAAKQLPNGFYLAQVILRKAESKIDSGHFDVAATYLEQLFLKCPEGQSLLIDLKSTLVQGQIHRGLKEEQKALKARESSILKAQCMAAPRYIWRSHHSLGRFYHHQRRFEEARDHYRTALKWIDRVASTLDTPFRKVFLHERDRLQVYQDFVILQISTGHKESAAKTLKRLNSETLNRKIAHLFK
jgi:tetratricopeptide (TPR) repeat protein